MRLADEEREIRAALTSTGRTQAHRMRHAAILPKVDADGPNWSDERTAEAVGCHRNTVRNVRQRCVERGFESVLEREAQDAPSRARKLDGAAEARPTRSGTRWTSTCPTP